METRGRTKKASGLRDMFPALKGSVTNLEDSIGYMKEDLDVVEGCTIELNLVKDQLKGHVMNAFNSKVGEMQGVLTSTIGKLIERDGVLEAMLIALKGEIEAIVTAWNE
ncbi:serine carboxypeptidase-like 18 [Gossypium australe]|uniref:Serine carboxypeptidase-like 18 n=1 Tax=Gossypium australe TaxID=47621 RepID=A0A5B6VE51_9ROSI|nr:serine carboxypeptidase-like 18 [Gossypium australe]